MIESLDMDQVLQFEFQLLNSEGESLSDFYCPENTDSIFFQTKPFSQVSNLKVKKIKTTANHSNAIFEILTYIFVQIIFEKRNTNQLLQHLKTVLYSSNVNLCEIKNIQKGMMSNFGMKRILTQFFQMMLYSKGEIQTRLMKYPIVTTIFTFFFRTILNILQIPEALDYQKRISSKIAITQIFDFLDFQYHFRRSLYIIPEYNIVLYVEKQSDQTFFGKIQHPSDEKSTISFNIQEKYSFQFENNKQQKQINLHTPVFGQLLEQNSFSGLVKNRKNSFQKGHFQNQQKQSFNSIGKSQKSTKNRRLSQNNLKINQQHRNIQIMIDKQIKQENYSNKDSINPQYNQEDCKQRTSFDEIDQTKDNINDRISPASHQNKIQHSFEKTHKAKSQIPNILKIKNKQICVCSCYSTKINRNSIKSQVMGLQIQCITTMKQQKKKIYQYKNKHLENNKKKNVKKNLFYKLSRTTTENNMPSFKTTMNRRQLIYSSPSSKVYTPHINFTYSTNPQIPQLSNTQPFLKHKSHHHHKTNNYYSILNK